MASNAPRKAGATPASPHMSSYGIPYADRRGAEEEVALQLERKKLAKERFMLAFQQMNVFALAAQGGAAAADVLLEGHREGPRAVGGARPVPAVPALPEARTAEALEDDARRVRAAVAAVTRRPRPPLPPPKTPVRIKRERSSDDETDDAGGGSGNAPVPPPKVRRTQAGVPASRDAALVFQRRAMQLRRPVLPPARSAIKSEPVDDDDDDE
jgi:hypothetical protein